MEYWKLTEDDKKPYFGKLWREDMAAPEVRGLSNSAFRVYATLKVIAFTPQGYGAVQELIGDFAGFSRRTVQRALSELAEIPLVKSEYRHNAAGEQLGNHWVVLSPPSVLAMREAGKIPPQAPPRRQEGRPPWRQDRRPRASGWTPEGGVTDGALHREPEIQGEVLTERAVLVPGRQSHRGKWPGLLGMVDAEITAETLRALAEWAHRVNKPTRSDVQRRLEQAVRDTAAEDYKAALIARLVGRSEYDMSTGGRHVLSLNHAVRSGWKRASRTGLNRALAAILPKINTVEKGDWKGIIETLRSLAA